jgi:hypothetical protein
MIPTIVGTFDTNPGFAFYTKIVNHKFNILAMDTFTFGQKEHALHNPSSFENFMDD